MWGQAPRPQAVDDGHGRIQLSALNAAASPAGCLDDDELEPVHPDATSFGVTLHGGRAALARASYRHGRGHRDVEAVGDPEHRQAAGLDPGSGPLVGDPSVSLPSAIASGPRRSASVRGRTDARRDDPDAALAQPGDDRVGRRHGEAAR